jgi:hypothetical protein
VLGFKMKLINIEFLNYDKEDSTLIARLQFEITCDADLYRSALTTKNDVERILEENNIKYSGCSTASIDSEKFLVLNISINFIVDSNYDDDIDKSFFEFKLYSIF